MKKLAPPPPRALDSALVAASLASLLGGALLAVPLHGVPRFVVGMGGFAGYIALFARALEGFGLRAVPTSRP